MSISSEKLYTEPGSIEEMELQKEQERVRDTMNKELFDEEIGASEEAFKPAKKQTGAKKCKGKTVALTLLVAGTLVAGSIFGTKAVHNLIETKRADDLIGNYTTEEYVMLPKQVTTDRAYDVTYVDGQKLLERLNNKNMGIININGQFYTPNGTNVAIITYKVSYTTMVDAIKVRTDGQVVYMPQNGYTLDGTQARKTTTETITKVVPQADDYSYIKFEGASNWEIVGEPQIVSTLPYEVIQNSTLICDVADGATLNDYNETTGTLDLAPKKH